MTRSRRVTIVQGFIPQYRVPFFRELARALESESVELTVVHGSPPASLEARGDARLPAGTIPVRTSAIGSRLVWHSVLPHVRDRDLVIVEQALRNLETYALLAARMLGGPRIAMWGHGRTFAPGQSPRAIHIKDVLTRRADWFFAYSDGGARYVAALGFPVERVTVVANSTDTTSLRRRIGQVTAEEQAELRARMGLPSGRLAVSIGGIDETKRPSFLLDAASRVAAGDPSFSLVIAGGGALAGWVADATSGLTWPRFVGPVFDDDKAVLLSMADLILVPGTLGLVAVDSFAARAPIVTTRSPGHGPEFEYLVHGENAWITEDDPAAFAAGVQQLWQDAVLRERLAAGCAEGARRITLEAMVDRFAGGVLDALAG